ncbi:MAG: Serine protease, subtilase family, partial [Solirubrobacterales bacterium]|nr:Serine protease, subtilase family [Solirubrobacterales bacterium]
LQTDASASAGKTDTPAFPAVGEPAFGTLDGATTSMFAPAAGLVRALDVVAPDYQKAGQDFIAGWNANSGQFAPGFPAVDNDLSFITGETIGDVTGQAPKQEVLAGTASLDLQAFDGEGSPASAAWPKLTGGWMVATPTLGSLGTLDTGPEAKKDVVSITREGEISVYSTPASACSPSSWPNFHHDIANSGDYTRDAVAPGRPLNARVAESVLHFTAPGDDLLCGKAARYEVVTSESPITAKTFASAKPLGGAPEPATAGTAQSYALPGEVQTYVAIRAVDEQGNLGLPSSVEYNPGPPLPALGRCVRAPVAKTGEWEGSRCVGFAHGKGAYDFLPGPGAAHKLAGRLGAVTLETTTKAKIACTAGSAQGEYTGSEGLTTTLTLTGCERVSDHEPCQSVGGATGQIVTDSLQGALGFIASAATTTVGLDLARQPALATFECTSPRAPGRELLALEGSVIGQLTKIDEMVTGFTVTYTARSGRQATESFEGGATDTLLTATVGGASEPTGLTATLAISSEEPLEVKAKTRAGK